MRRGTLRLVALGLVLAALPAAAQSRKVGSSPESVLALVGGRLLDEAVANLIFKESLRG